MAIFPSSAQNAFTSLWTNMRSGSRTTTGRPIRVLSRRRSPPGRGNHSSRGRGRWVHGIGIGSTPPTWDDRLGVPARQHPFHDARWLADRLGAAGARCWVAARGMVASAGLLLGGVLATDPRAIVAWFSLALGASRQTQQHNYARPLDITCVGDPGKTLGD